MKAIIDRVTFLKEGKNKWNDKPNYQYRIEYDGKMATYYSNVKDQKHFIEGKECEFDEVINDQYIVVKLPGGKSSNYSRAVKKEQSRYPGMAIAFSKDLVVADKIKISDMKQYADLIINWMIEKDKSIES